MSAAHVGALLTLLGLLFQVFAVILILARAGVFTEARQRVERAAVAGWQRVLKAIPWRHETTLLLDNSSTSLTLSGSGVDEFILEDQPAPSSFEEVGERLNELRRFWTEHDARFTREADRSRKAVDDAREEAMRRADEIEALRKEEARSAIRDRRAEGLLLVAGGILQVGGVAIILFAT